MADNGQSALLEMRGITKVFPGVHALDGVDFTLRRGEVHALMGENGAGKSTLIKVLTGVYRPDGGRIELEGKHIAPRTPPDAQRLGVSAVHQEVNLIPQLSIAENIFLGRQPMRLGRVDWKRIRSGAEEAVAKLDLKIDVSLPVSSYSIAIQQLTAIARALSVDAKVLVLDEPTSSLAAAEVERLFGVIAKLKAAGMGIIFVTHFLDQAYAVSDRFTVLRNGKLVGEYEAAKLPRLELVSKMIGRDASEAAAGGRKGVAHAGEAFLTAKDISRKHVGPIKLEARKGEILGLAGLLGSGRTETVRLLFGVERPESGTIEIGGRQLKLSSPRAAIDAGIGFCPEDRKSDGIIPDLSIRDNIILALQSGRGWLRRIPKRKAAELADKYIKALNIATPDADKPIGELSGGNQQKVILARWLASEPKLLILDEPTRGVDIGAKAEISKYIESLCAEGMAIIFISSELEEVARDSHRVIVLRDGKQVGELTSDAVSLPEIMKTIAGKK